ncbi:K(+)/H(+) antiporter [Tulasnella sp. 403]|nr:K(+)/H(+) antiporter [Tulasnella sp. 403]
MSRPGSFSGPFIDLGGSILRRAVAQQGGLLDGEDPTEFNPSAPIRLWIIQLGIIIITTQILSLGLAKMRQPKVIAEVIGGIVLGPTLMGRIPGFTEHIFPPQSRPYLSLTAEIGLVLFLFLVGLEIDTQVIKRNARTSFIISTGGILIPFGLGAAVAVAVYNQFVDSANATFSHFLLFVGVAFSITAFPVLCRILTELKLLDDVVGIVVLSAGVGNDIVGWVLLALTVALVNASSGLTALYVLLVSVGWTLFILFPCRWAYRWLARWTGSTELGPTPLFMTATILLTFTSAFMTDVIGVNAIFGGFLAGLAIPREGNLNITITEKLEDMVAIIFLPLYFTLSGLSTNLGLLNTGLIWGYTIMILVVAYLGKFIGGTLAARVAGFSWRVSTTVGTLMSCKGLIELIVLNVGLSAGILDTRVFSMFVLEAVVLTFACTPVALWLYPPEIRIRAAGTGANFGGIGEAQQPRPGGVQIASEKKDRFLVVLDKMGHEFEAHLIILSWTSPLDYSRGPNPLHDVALTVNPTAATTDTSAPVPATHSNNPFEALFRSQVAAQQVSSRQERVTSVAHSHFIRRLFASAPTDVALYVDNQALRQGVGSRAHLVIPFFGGPDDRLALEFVVQLCTKEGVSATVIRVRKEAVEMEESEVDAKAGVSEKVPIGETSQESADIVTGAPISNTVHSMAKYPDTIYPNVTTQTRMASDTADNICWFKYAPQESPDAAPPQHTPEVQEALARITFTTLSSPTPLKDLIARISGDAIGKRQLVVVGRAKRLAVESHQDEMKSLLSEQQGFGHGGLGNEMRKTLGDVATAFVVSGVPAGLLVMQASASTQLDA